MKKFFFGVLPWILVLFLQACESERKGSTGFVKTSEESVQTEMSGRPDVALTVWVGEQEGDITKKMADAFCRQYPDVEFHIQVETVQGDIAGKVAADVASGPDVYPLTDRDVAVLLDSMALQPVVPDGESVADENWSVLGAGRDGVLYAYPMAVTGGYILYYDRDFFLPEDVAAWESMEEKAKTGEKRIGLRLDGDGGEILYSFLSGAGLELKREENGKITCRWDAPAGKKICEKLRELGRSEMIVPENGDDLLEKVKSGEVAALFGTVEDGVRICQAMGDRFACTVLPRFAFCGQTKQMLCFTGFRYLGVNPFSDNVGYAMMLARWLTNGENQLARYESLGVVPTNRACCEEKRLVGTPAGALSRQSRYGYLRDVRMEYEEPTRELWDWLLFSPWDTVPLTVRLEETVRKITG